MPSINLCEFGNGADIKCILSIHIQFKNPSFFSIHDPKALRWREKRFRMNSIVTLCLFIDPYLTFLAGMYLMAQIKLRTSNRVTWREVGSWQRVKTTEWRNVQIPPGWTSNETFEPNELLLSSETQYPFDRARWPPLEFRT